MTTLTAWNKVVANMDKVAADKILVAQRKEAEEKQEIIRREEKEKDDCLAQLNAERKKEYMSLYPLVESLNIKRMKAKIAPYVLKETYHSTIDECLDGVWKTKFEIEKLDMDAEMLYADIVVPSSDFNKIKMRWNVGIDGGSCPLPFLKDIVKAGKSGFSYFYDACERKMKEIVSRYNNRLSWGWSIVDENNKDLSFGDAFKRAYTIKTVLL